MALAAIRYAGPKPGSRIHCYNPPVPELTESAVERDPFVQFAKWYAEARAVVKPHPNAAALATAAGGRASVRMVLVKDHDRNGFVFYTNYASRKARELRRSARASLLFYWGTLERQVRVDGRIEKVTRRESDGYFATRPRGSQLSAWASPQSETMPGRAALEERYAAAAARYTGEVPRPPSWGGYRLIPETIEFWQGRDDRLHDRIRYGRTRNGRWRIERLAP
jgi:pyridoxamine 5'-phosphate oxidase